jgi:hypothetical protein
MRQRSTRRYEVTLIEALVAWGDVTAARTIAEQALELHDGGNGEHVEVASCSPLDRSSEPSGGGARPFLGDIVEKWDRGTTARDVHGLTAALPK